MGDKSAISWCDATWNPVTGCSVVSPGCEHCYAETFSLRMGWSKKPWTAINAAENVVLHPDRLDLPLRWKKPRMIFVNSMSDLFHAQVPDEFIDQVLTTMIRADRHVYQVLTKRPERMWRYFREAMTRLPWTQWPLPHVWLGTSVEDQRRADERIPHLVDLRWPIHFLSCEPLLGPVDLTPWADCLQWVIDGGESGPNFRRADPDWYRAIRDACGTAGVPYFHKQGNHFKSGQDTLLDGREHHAFPEAA